MPHVILIKESSYAPYFVQHAFTSTAMKRALCQVLGRQGLANGKFTVSCGANCPVGRQKISGQLMKKIISSCKNKWSRASREENTRAEKGLQGQMKELRIRRGEICSESYRKLASELRKESKTNRFKSCLPGPCSVPPTVLGISTRTLHPPLPRNGSYVLSSTLCCLATYNCAIQSAIYQFLVLLKDDLHLYFFHAQPYSKPEPEYFLL